MAVEKVEALSIRREVVLRAVVARAEWRNVHRCRPPENRAAVSGATHGNRAEDALRIDKQQLTAVAAPHGLRPPAGRQDLSARLALEGAHGDFRSPRFLRDVGHEAAVG